jgi:hypothetical protein
MCVEPNNFATTTNIVGPPRRGAFRLVAWLRMNRSNAAAVAAPGKLRRPATVRHHWDLDLRELVHAQ